jgi:carbon monoxide dehydrogenase subunit G
MRLEDSFEAPAPPDRVWTLLNDVPRVVPCMPGAALVGQVDERTWKASIKVKLGPIAMSFTADIRQEDVDAAAHRMRLVADAREDRGRGMAKANIETTVRPSGSGSAVDIATDVDLSGAVAQYGRGIVKDVAGQLTKAFAENLRAQLESSDDPPETAPAASAATPISGFQLLLRALVARFRRRRDG